MDLNRMCVSCISAKNEPVNTLSQDTSILPDGSVQKQSPSQHVSIHPFRLIHGDQGTSQSVGLVYLHETAQPPSEQDEHLVAGRMRSPHG